MKASVFKWAISTFSLFSFFRATACEKAGDTYPSEWWAPIPREQAASWEILPQDAGVGEVILSKRHSLGVLSNFSEAPFELDGVTYRSLEGFWQAMKYPESSTDERALFPGLQWKFTRADVAQMIAFEAKAAGDLASANMKKMGINWVSYRGEKMEYRTTQKGAHFELVVRATRAKVFQNSNVKEILVKTGNLILKPDHREEEPIPPAWKYYDILTEIRNELLCK